MASTTGSPRSIKTTSTVFEIVEAVREHDGAGITRLADELGLAKSTVHDHLKTLEEEGYLVQRPGGDYDLSLRFLDHGTYARNCHKVFQVARPMVDRLAEESDEIAWLEVEEAGMAVLLYKHRGTKAVDILDRLARIGRQNYLHDHAGGKALLAGLPDGRIESIVAEQGLPGWTDQTITDRERLWDEVEAIRREGVAYNNGELLDSGGKGVGAPITFDGDVVGSISVTGPAERFGETRLEDELVPLVRGLSNEIELNLIEVFR